jgi:tetratricopeptide (TPR) repeat protein
VFKDKSQESWPFAELNIQTLSNIPVHPGCSLYQSSSGNEVLLYGLPDHLAGLLSPFYLIRGEQQNIPISAYKSEDITNSSIQKRPSIFVVNNRVFFVQALLPFRSSASSTNDGIIIWVKTDLISIQKLLSSFAENLRKPTTEPQFFYADVANNILTANGGIGLHSLATLSYSSETPFPTVEEIFESTSPFPGLSNVLESSEPEKLIKNIFEISSRTALEEIVNFENAVISDPTLATSLLDGRRGFWHFSGRAQLAAGYLHRNQNDFEIAKKYFHRAQLLDMPGAFVFELDCMAKITEPFRKKYPEVFNEISRGDRFRAITTLRQAASFEPLAGNAILAFCLRGANESEEGLAACEKALAIDPEQADVLGHKWSYLFDLMRDADALEVALSHIRSYPQDISGIINALDSHLLLHDPLSAKLLAHRYLIHTENLQLALKHFYKTYEVLSDWESLAELFESTLALVSGPTAEILALYGEILIELSQFKNGAQVFERALEIEPDNVAAILGFSRLLARSGNDAKAQQLLETVLADKSRVFKDKELAFLVSMLAEILRRNGKAAQAVKIFNAHFPNNIIEVSKLSGPQPAFQLIESLMELGEITQAQSLATQLHEIWHHDPLVSELFRACHEQ